MSVRHRVIESLSFLLALRPYLEGETEPKIVRLVEKNSLQVTWKYL